MKNINYKTNRPLFIGNLALAIYFVTSEFGILSEFVRGFLFGIALVGYSIGLYGINHDLTKIKEWKKTLLKGIKL